PLAVEEGRGGGEDEARPARGDTVAARDEGAPGSTLDLLGVVVDAVVDRESLAARAGEARGARVVEPEDVPVQTTGGGPHDPGRERAVDRVRDRRALAPGQHVQRLAHRDPRPHLL